MLACHSLNFLLSTLTDSILLLSIYRDTCDKLEHCFTSDMASSKQSVSDEFPPPEVSTAFSIQGLEPQLFKIQGSPLPSAIKIALTLIDTIICKYPRGYKIMSVEPFQGTEFAELEELPNPESITIYIGTSVKSFELPLVPTDYKIDIRKMAYYSQKCDWSCLIASDIINACVKNDKSKSDQPGTNTYSKS